MSLVVANAQEQQILEYFLETEDLYLRLYTNNVIPAETDTAASYNNVVAGSSGYAPILLDKDDWAITAGAPTFAVQPEKIFSFAAGIDIPFVIYGYYIVNGAGVLRWAERFPGANVPFTPIAGSSIKITPRIECS